MSTDQTAQFELFGDSSAAMDLIGSVPLPVELANLPDQLPKRVRLGTSSWSFPGWAGIVYTKQVGEQLLARSGLAAYANHPLLRAVGLDRTFYAPLAAAEFGRYAAAVPEDFRFVVKAHAVLTTPPATAQRAAVRADVDRFLDSEYAVSRVIDPAVEGLGERLGAILFQFPPLSHSYLRDPRRFAEALGAFLRGLPAGPRYSVELRNSELLTAEYADVLASCAVTHCFNVHSRMPNVLEQAKLLGASAWQHDTIVIRWMLHPTQQYEDARARYFPFDRIVDSDPANRTAIARLIETLQTMGKQVVVIANNKAEGCAPLTLFALARELGQRAELALPS